MVGQVKELSNHSVEYEIDMRQRNRIHEFLNKVSGLRILSKILENACE